jgi:hypothetical protein
MIGMANPTIWYILWQFFSWMNWLQFEINIYRYKTWIPLVMISYGVQNCKYSRNLSSISIVNWGKIIHFVIKFAIRHSCCSLNILRPSRFCYVENYMYASSRLCVKCIYMKISLNTNVYVQFSYSSQKIFLSIFWINLHLYWKSPVYCLNGVRAKWRILVYHKNSNIHI